MRMKPIFHSAPIILPYYFLHVIKSFSTLLNIKMLTFTSIYLETREDSARPRFLRLIHLWVISLLSPFAPLFFRPLSLITHLLNFVLSCSACCGCALQQQKWQAPTVVKSLAWWRPWVLHFMIICHATEVASGTTKANKKFTLGLPQLSASRALRTHKSRPTNKYNLYAVQKLSSRSHLYT